MVGTVQEGSLVLPGEHTSLLKYPPNRDYLSVDWTLVAQRLPWLDNRMPVVHVAHGGLSATIYTESGLAFLPDLGIYKIWYVHVGGQNFFKKNIRLSPDLPWERCVKFEMPEITDAMITLEDERNMPFMMHFQGRECHCKRKLALMIRIQAWWRRVLGRKRDAHLAKLEVLVMGLHPRAGADSLLTVDILWTVAGNWLV
jgi:hypothetical protein